MGEANQKKNANRKYLKLLGLTRPVLRRFSRSHMGDAGFNCVHITARVMLEKYFRIPSPSPRCPIHAAIITNIYRNAVQTANKCFRYHVVRADSYTHPMIYVLPFVTAKRYESFGPV